MISSEKQRALFLDRDGIFNELIPWGEGGALCAPRHWDEVRRYDTLRDLTKIKSLGFFLVMVTNQPDVERGITEEKFVRELNESYRCEFALDGVYVCWSASDSDPMKKPNPGMFLQAAQDLSLDLSRSFHLGDTSRDVEAAQRCGCRSILWNRPYNQIFAADYRVDGVSELHSLLTAMDNEQ